MEPLTQRSCVACRSDTPTLTLEEITRLQPQIPQWVVEENRRLRHTFRFQDFVTALAFVNQIGALAEEEGHHPDLYLAWGKVGVVLWTHKIGGLSDNDFIMAAKTDVLAQAAPGRKADVIPGAEHKASVRSSA